MLPIRSVLALLVAVAVAACSESPPAAAGGGPAGGSGGPAGAGGAGAAPPPPTVSVVRVAARSVPLVLEAVGRTEGSREVELRARVTGIVERQSFVEGEPVKAGAPMYRIDPAPFEIALAQARAALAQERSRNEQARREAARLRRLVEQRAISQREFDEATTQSKSSAAAIQLAEARVREAELNLSYTTVRAPIAGIAGRSLRSVGSLVTPGADSSLLTTITQTDPLWVRFALSETEFAQLRSGAGNSAEVRVRTADGKLHPQSARLNFAASNVDARLGTVQMRAELPNPGLALLPGQFLRVEITAAEQDAILVPQHAVLQAEQGRIVWTVSADGKAVPRPVELGRWVGDDWIVRSGLASGDRVIVDNLMKLRPGAPVRIDAGAPAATGEAAQRTADSAAADTSAAGSAPSRGK